ncbi:hypothetical protein D1P53_003009 [Cryptococcus gattii VGV]|nr:hypothetical protein D1P53_003009 [Cryptococcus gattii VGV]
MSVLKEVGGKGLSEEKLAREWEDQKKTQEDEGQIEASVERRRNKELKTSVAPGSEKLKEAERLLENLLNKEKECGGDLEKLARELGWCQKDYTAYPDANILDVFKGVVYLLKKHLEEHRQLEQRWVADGLSILWNAHMVPENFRQDQGLQRQYQDLHHRVLAVHHEPHYEATLPISRICRAR